MQFSTDDKMKQRIVISSDFSPYPMGRYRKLSKTSGEAFREDHLIPALRRGGSVHVEFAGAYGYPASFVEEAFGGLVRSGFKLTDLQQRLILEEGTPEFAVYIAQAWQYIRDASERL